MFNTQKQRGVISYTIYIDNNHFNLLQINDYTHDLIMESSSILVEDELNEEVTLTTEENMLMRGGYRCIACKNAIFDHNKKKLYLDHLRYLRRLSEIAQMLSKNAYINQIDIQNLSLVHFQ